MKIVETLRRSTVPAWLKFLLVAGAAIALATALDPYLGFFGSPLAAQLLNAVLPVIFMLLILGLTGRIWMALLAEAALLALLAFADATKMFYLNTDLLYADFKVLGGLLRDPHLVLGFVHWSAGTIALGILALLAVTGFWWVTRHTPRASRRLRTGCLIVAALGMAVVWKLPAPSIIESVHWQVYQQRTGARDVGVAGNIMLGRMTTQVAQPAPDAGKERAFWDEPLVRAARQEVDEAGDPRRPDIVIVQSESLFAPRLLKGFADRPMLPNIVGVGSPFGGELQVPVFGSRTLQSEFETLTGAPIAFYPGSMFAYYELVDHPINALPRVLDDLGYRTMVIHPNKRGYWNRGAVMPALGFGTFQDFGSFILPRDVSDRGMVSDQILMRSVLAELDAANRPTFVFAISMENHGPWGDFAPKDESGLGLPAQLTGDARAAMADYVAHAKAADHALAFLLDALNRRGRPAIVLLYGDHLPALPEVYAQLGFKDGQPPWMHDPPYRVWANFPLPPVPPVTSAYLLQGWLMRAAGLPLQGHVLANALAGMVAADPAVDEAERKRVLDEYANIAAANVAATARRADPARTVFFGRQQALAELLKLRVPTHPDEAPQVRDDDLYLDGSAGKPVKLTLATRGALASLTLRPYVRTLANGGECVGQGSVVNTARITVEGDGRVLYRALVARQTVRLATLDLRGVQKLEVRADHFTALGACAGLNVRVAQLACYSARCDEPGPARPEAGQSPAPARIPARDPMGGDLAALAKSRPVGQSDLRRANLRWLLGRTLAQQQGLAPFRVQPDGQIFMHPAEDRAAWMDFNVDGVDELELTPRINTLDSGCAALDDPGKEGGVVGLTFLLDGKPLVPRQVIKRDFRNEVTLDVRGGHDLRVEVDKGNDVAWCDWFSLGVDEIRGAGFPGNQ